jgi:hypothetical protein
MQILSKRKKSHKHYIYIVFVCLLPYGLFLLGSYGPQKKDNDIDNNYKYKKSTAQSARDQCVHICHMYS